MAVSRDALMRFILHFDQELQFNFILIVITQRNMHLFIETIFSSCADAYTCNPAKYISVVLFTFILK